MFALLALICFILALFKVAVGTLDLTVLGLAFIAAHLLLGEPWLVRATGRLRG